MCSPKTDSCTLQPDPDIRPALAQCLPLAYHCCSDLTRSPSDLFQHLGLSPGPRSQVPQPWVSAGVKQLLGSHDFRTWAGSGSVHCLSICLPHGYDVVYLTECRCHAWLISGPHIRVTHEVICPLACRWQMLGFSRLKLLSKHDVVGRIEIHWKCSCPDAWSLEYASYSDKGD
jgi:hypothetical protein